MTFAAGQIFRASRDLHRPLAGTRRRTGTRQLRAVSQRALRCSWRRPAGPGFRQHRDERLRVRTRRAGPGPRRRLLPPPHRSLQARLLRAGGQTVTPKGRQEGGPRPARSVRPSRTCAARGTQRQPRLGRADAERPAPGRRLRARAAGVAWLAAVHPGVRRRPRAGGLCRLLRPGKELRAVPRPAVVPHLPGRPAAGRGVRPAGAHLDRSAVARSGAQDGAGHTGHRRTPRRGFAGAGSGESPRGRGGACS